MPLSNLRLKQETSCSTRPLFRSRPRVVLVKNQSLIRSSIERWLAPECDLAIFSDAEGALSYVQTLSDVSLLISGLNLRDSSIGGCSVAREVRKHFPSVPVLMLEWGSQADFRNLLLSGMPNVVQITSIFDLWLRRGDVLSLIHRGKD